MDMQSFEEEFGSRIKLPKSIAKIWSALGMAYDCKFNKDFEECNLRIKKMHDKYKGEKCFIVGTGPSINKTDLSLIKDTYVFGVNTLYRAMDRFGKGNCWFWAVVDKNVLEKHHKQISDLGITTFICENAGKEYLRNREKYRFKVSPLVLKNLGSMNVWNRFSNDIVKGVYSGGSVVMQCIQIAYYMGFSRAYLLGCDCSYEGDLYRFDEKGAENPRGKGITGEWDYLFSAYKVAKREFEKDGRRIYNSTVGGKLEVFERKNMEEIR